MLYLQTQVSLSLLSSIYLSIPPYPSFSGQLADFGLAKVYHSVSKETKNNDWEEGGTINYMPPEAFKLSYKPTKASDIYRYITDLTFSKTIFNMQNGTVF